jgi:hypothetical protein
MGRLEEAFLNVKKSSVFRTCTSKYGVRISNLTFKWYCMWFCPLQASTHITCKLDKGFIYWNPSVEIPTIDPVLSDGEGIGGKSLEVLHRRPNSVSKRSIAETESQQEQTFVHSTSKVVVQPSTSNFSFPPTKRTMFLNCTNDNVDCIVVKCTGGPFLPNKTQAVINFQLRPDLEILGTF